MIKTIYKIPVFRYTLITLLIALLCGTTFYFNIQYNKAQKRQRDVNRLISVHENSTLIDSCILTLYSADNNSRLYSVTGETKYLTQFANQVKQVDLILDRINAAKGFTVSSSSQKISNLMDGKRLKTQDYLRLRHRSDSLIAALIINPKIGETKSVTAVSGKVGKAVYTSDTLAAKKHKNLFKRIASSFARDKSNDEFEKGVQSRSTRIDTVFVTVSKATSAQKHYKDLYRANLGLRSKEREMLIINSGIINELISVLQRYKREELNFVRLSKKELRGTLLNVFSDFSQLSFFAGILLFMLIAVLLYNLWKIFKHEEAMVSYSAAASTFAEEKSLFLANMSHEIRTPLNSIAGFAEQLELSQLNDEQTGQIKAIRTSSGMLLSVVNQILDYSKFETGKMNFDSASFMLDKVITEVCASMNILAEQKGLHLRTELQYSKDLLLAGDAFRLRQVIMNLIGNSIKFTAQGEVTVKVWTTKTDSSKQNLHVIIKDTGIGIDRIKLPFIFKEFTQAGTTQKQNRTGTGLGLAISKSIIELQGGEIMVESELGIGSVFSFMIPFGLGDRIASDAKISFDEQGIKDLLKDKHVLLAEDNSMNVLLAKTILKKWNITCEVAYDGKEALDLFEKKDFDLVLTDILMPVMGGVELAVSIRNLDNQHKAATPILALTANVLKEDHDLYLRAGIDDVAMKPFFEKELIHKIELLLKGSALRLA